MTLGTADGQNPPMRISAKADYGLRALIELAVLEKVDGKPVKRDQLGAAQDIPVAFLENILLELKRAGIVMSVRGQQGGFRLSRPADEVSLAQVIRALDGPLASVRGVRPEDVDYPGNALPLRDVWIAVRTSLRAVLEEVTLADLVSGELPAALHPLLETPEAWRSH